MEKPIKESVAIVIYDDNHEKVLVVRRPLDDESLPGYWGFPAASRKDPSETWEELAHKAALTKLGVKIEIVRFLGEDTIDRGKFILKLQDFECRIIEGNPVVPQPDNSVTQYIESKYTNDFEPLKASADKGSLCTRIFLRDRGLRD